MAQKSKFSPEDLPKIREAMAQIGEEPANPRPALFPITAIERDPSTGEITVSNDPKAEPLSGRQLLDELANQTDFLGKSVEIATSNTRLAARLGAIATGHIYPGAIDYSKTELSTLHKSLKSVHRKIVGAVLVSKELRRDPEALRELNRFINPNPRLKKHYEELDKRGD